MARIAGIQFEKDARGKRRYVRIDLKKHGNDIAPFLEKMGAMEEDEFEREWKNSITGNVLMQRLRPRIKNLFDK
jgi:hypothetical protein